MKPDALKILIVGSTLPGALENYYRKYLDRNRFEVLSFDPSAFYTIKSIGSKIKFRYFTRSLYKVANAQLIAYADQAKPDVIWIFKGIEFFPETLKQIKKRNIALINYNPDHPFIRTFVSNGGRNIRDCVPYYDLHFCYSRDLVLQLQTEYSLKAIWLPFGFDLSQADYDRIAGEEEVVKVSFIGNPDALRAKVVERIGRNGIAVDVYGHNWDKYLKHGNSYIRTYGQVNGFDYWKTLRKYRVQLNVFRPHNVNSHNMRTFEIPACGGIQLAPASDEHTLFFTEGKEIFLYHTEEEMIEKINVLLGLSSEGAERLRGAARQRVLDDLASYEHRAKQAGEAIMDICI